MGSRKTHRCSNCGSSLLRRSRTRIWERPLRLILFRPYRCRDCEHRCYAFTLRDQSNRDLASASNSVNQTLTHGLRLDRGKWMLASGLAACILIGGIAAAKFRNNLPRWHSLSEIRSSLLQRVNQSRNELSPREPSNSPAIPSSSTASREDGPVVSRDDDIEASSPPKAIRAVRPKLPVNMQSRVTSDNIVKVRVRINRSGKVISATAVSTEGPVATLLAGYALDSARRWRFRPARNNGKPVGSQSVLEFVFRPSNT